MDTEMDVEMKDSNQEAEVREKLKAIIDVSDPKFGEQIRQLADNIGFHVYHPDPVVLLQAICIYVEKELKRPKIDTSEKVKANIDEIPLGMKSSGDPDVDKAVKILRLLNVEQLRRHQTQINAILAEVQKITANPKTDLQLGKVGR